MPRHGKPIYEVTVNGRPRWCVRASIRRGGQRKQLVKTFDTYEEAEKFYAETRLGAAVPRSRDTFKQWTEIWLQRKRDEECRENTVYGYEIDLIRPLNAFGSARIQEVTAEMIQDVVREMRDEGLARRTSAKMLTTVRSVFDLALRKGVIQFNPALEVTPMGRPPRERDALTANELEKLRKAIAGDPWEACWMLTLAGLRRSELLGLRWNDFNARTGELVINKGRVPRGGVGKPKTARGYRVLPLDQERIGLLVALQSWQEEVFGSDQAIDGLIVINEFGRPMRPEEWSARWRKLCKDTRGVRDDHTLHAARHSTVTFMRNAGVPDHIVAAWHGHDEVVMRRTYSHVHSQEMRSAGSALSFGGRPPVPKPKTTRQTGRAK
jgi:integrase